MNSTVIHVTTDNQVVSESPSPHAKQGSESLFTVDVLQSDKDRLGH